MPKSAPRRDVLIERVIAAGEHAPAGLIWRLAIPVMLQNFLGMFVGWSDTILAGQILGREEFLAAGAVVGYLLWLIETLGGVIHTGAHPIIARHLGSRRVEAANHVVIQSMMLAVVLGTFFTGAVWALSDTSAMLLNLQGESGRLVGRYLRIVSTCCIPMMIMVVGTTCLRAAGHNLAAMWIFLGVNIANIIVSWTLAVGIGPVPTLGWDGIAIGTAVSFFAGGALTLATLVRGSGDLHLLGSGWKPDSAVIRKIFEIGIPGAATNLVIVICQLWFLSIIGHLGDSATAAHGVAIRCESISWLWGESFAIAAATLVGQSLGAGRPDLARRLGWASFRLSTIVLSILGVCFWFIAEPMASIFTGTDAVEVRQQGAAMLRVVAFGMPALSASMVLTGALRGAGDTRGPFLYNAVGMLLFRIPLAYALTDGIVSWGLFGAWSAMLVDLYVRGFLSWVRYRADLWTRISM